MDCFVPRNDGIPPPLRPPPASAPSPRHGTPTPPRHTHPATAHSPRHCTPTPPRHTHPGPTHRRHCEERSDAAVHGSQALKIRVNCIFKTHAHCHLRYLPDPRRGAGQHRQADGPTVAGAAARASPPSPSNATSPTAAWWSAFKPSLPEATAPAWQGFFNRRSSS
jgi:hypothetical protein